MIRDAIIRVSAGKTLSQEDAASVMEEIMEGQATPAQMGAFLTALRLRPNGETAEEISGFAQVMRDKASRVYLDEDLASQILDTCGTGGDMAHTFNVSTASGILAAAAGAKVAKHGNRSASSKSGSADVLEALGMKINLTPEQVAQSIRHCGFGFMFAQAFHPAMKYVGPIRGEIGIRTVFNTLGPLTNPAHTRYQVLGVPDRSLLRKMGEVLLHLGSHHALIVHGADGLDELSLSAPSYICEIDSQSGIREYTITPEELGFNRLTDNSAIRGGGPEQNAMLLRDLFNSYSDHPNTQMVCLNTAAALLACQIVSSLADGVKLAKETLRSGKGKATLAAAIECSQLP